MCLQQPLKIKPPMISIDLWSLYVPLFETAKISRGMKRKMALLSMSNLSLPVDIQLPKHAF